MQRRPDPELIALAREGSVDAAGALFDRYWTLAQELGCTVIRPIEDRYYGLRDFTIAGPDGVGLRFASRTS